MVGFRVTNQMVLDTVVNNLNQNEQSLQAAQQQVSSGHVINQPSDNPFVASQAVLFKQRIGLNTQLQKNLDSANGWLTATDSALSSVDSVLQRARQLAIQGSNDTLTPSDRQKIALEMHQILLNVVDVANSKFGGQYIFGGTKTTSQPFIHDGSSQSPNISYSNPSPVTYLGDSGAVTRQTDQAAQIKVNVEGSQLTPVFSDLAQLEYDLNNSSVRVSGSKPGIDLTHGTLTGNGVATFKINGISIGTSTAATINGAAVNVIGFAANTKISTVVNQINAQSGQTGVTASVDSNGVLMLQAVPGSASGKVVVSGVDTVTTTATGADLTNGTGTPVPTGGNTVADLGLSNQMDNAIGSVDVTALDKDLDTIQTLRSQVGAKQNRVQDGTTRMSSLGITLMALDSNIEDVDMTKAVTALATAQTTFQAALGAAAKVLPPTLLDFLH